MLDVLVKFLNWFFNRVERRFGLHIGRKRPTQAERPCPVCDGDGLLTTSGDVCPTCHGSGRVEQ